MSKLLREHNIPFTQVPDALITNPEISGNAKAVYCYLASRPHGWTFFINEICKNMKEGKYSVKASLKELEEFGYIIRKRTSDENGRFTYDFYIYFTPQETPEPLGSCSYEKSCTSNEPHVDSPRTVPPQVVRTTCGESATNNIIPISNKEESNNNKKKYNKKENLSGFEEWYSLYPNKKSRGTAEKAWAKLDDDEKTRAFDSLKRWLATGAFNEDKKFIKHPATWLNGKCYDDEIEITKPYTPNPSVPPQPTSDTPPCYFHGKPEQWEAYMKPKHPQKPWAWNKQYYEQLESLDSQFGNDEKQLQQAIQRLDERFRQ